MNARDTKPAKANKPREPPNLQLGEDVSIEVWDDKHNQWTWKKNEAGKRIRDQKIAEGKWRKIAMPSWLMQELQLYINTNPSGIDKVWKVGWLSFERIIQKWTSSILHSKRSWHCLRHTYMSLHIEAKASIPFLVKQTGDTPGTIMNTYAQISVDALRDQTEKLIL